MHSQNDILISLSYIYMQYDRKIILRDINIDIRRNDFLAITGPNGGGKTTLLRLILRLAHPTRGQVRYLNRGVPVKNLSIGYLPQKNLIDSRFPITVKEVIELGLLADKNINDAERRKRIFDTIELMGLQDHAGHAIGELSGGQLQRTLIGRALISHPDILVLDEPLSYLDKHYEHELYNIIAGLAADTTIILVSHEMSTIAGMANRHIIVDHELHECQAARHYAHASCDEE